MKICFRQTKCKIDVYCRKIDILTAQNLSEVVRNNSELSSVISALLFFIIGNCALTYVKF